jgi:hypothetical protein
LANSTTYTATITTAVTDLAGNALLADYIWPFTTVPDTTAPTVLSTIPADTATGVAVNIATITASFSESLDCATVTAASFTVTDSLLNPAPGTVSCSGSTATYTLSSNLAGGTVYTATITTTVTDLAGNPLAADYVWNFTTI